ncbi:MAG: outer membrane protein assembly factor BamE [Alphaproteobacteria bacterium]|nr:outer membrane protein assembly factor BamE [Alphaproteobacteria bacterium]MDP6815032.1 outer membrane protein assembly factor BamE [Alphaproteobacteria bacterium]
MLATVLLAIAITACSPIDASHGYIPDEEMVTKLRAGVHDRDSVAALLGSPTSVAKFNGETWFYVRRDAERIAFFDEKVVAQNVLAVGFDEAGIVSGVRRYSLADGQELEMVERETPTRGKELTVFEQFFGNLGRFTNQGGGPGRE